MVSSLRMKEEGKRGRERWRERVKRIGERERWMLILTIFPRLSGPAFAGEICTLSITACEKYM